MYQHLDDIQKLIYVFSKLPGLGQRSARRIVLHLLKDKEQRIKGLVDNLSAVMLGTTKCVICGNISSSEKCPICTSSSRDKKQIAVVEDIADLWALERGGSFNGTYHVLEFKTQNRGQLCQKNLDKLVQRCANEAAREVIIATNATMEGQSAGWLIAEHLKTDETTGIKISRLASGIPIGGEIDYLDEGTLTAAFEQRQNFG